jgi:hypothetical protein
MTLYSKRVTAGLFGLILPPLILVLFIVLIETFQDGYPQFVDLISRVAIPLSSLGGFAVMVPYYKWYSIAIALVFFPLMWWFLHIYWFGVVGMLYGRYS